MKQILSVQVLRGLAALSVAYGHAAYDALQMAARAGREMDPAFRELSAAGVDLFFVISGFVMVWSSRALFGQPGAAATFLGRRLARIVPLYWATTTLYLLAALVLPQALNSALPSLSEIVQSYLFIPYQRLDDGSFQPIYRLGWTLNYEMFFYICFAALLWLPAPRAVAALVLAFVLLVAGGSVLAPRAVPLQFWTQPIVLEFALGALVGYACLKGWRLPPAAGLAAVVVALVWFALATGGALPTGRFERLFVLGGPAALLLAGTTLIRTEAREGAAWRWLAVLGDASYALYLIHPIVIRAVNVAWSRFGPGDIGGGWPFIVVSLALSVLASVLVFRVFERPVTKRLQALARS